MTRAHFVKKARKDNPVVKKGESYWWWKFRYGGKHYSKVRPKNSQLTQSDFLSTVYEIEERIEGLTTDSDFESEVQCICDDLQNLMDETEDRHNNMPDQLQDSPIGEMLESRVDSVQEMIDELENIDLESEEILEMDVKEDNEQEEDEPDAEYKARIDLEMEEMENDAKSEVLSEIQAISYDGE